MRTTDHPFGLAAESSAIRDLSAEQGEERLSAPNEVAQQAMFEGIVGSSAALRAVLSSEDVEDLRARLFASRRSGGAPR